MGEGPKSPLSAQLIAAQLPARGAVPTFIAASSSSITFSFEPASDNGGSAILEYNLYAASATTDGATPEVYAEVVSYDGLSMDFVLDSAVETSQVLSAGTIYRFRFSATNTIGEGELSNSVTIALADPAVQPAQAALDRARCTKTSLFLTWPAVTPTDSLPVDGYKLYMTALGSGATICVYDGSAHSERLHYNVTGLATGGRYSFSVVSVNANGVSEPSLELLTVVCLAPKGFPRPRRLATTRNSVTIGWSAPGDSGGCPLLGYELFIDDGLGGGTFLQIDAPALQDKPYLTELTVTQEATADPAVGGAPLVTGQRYRFKLVALNEVGSVESTNFAEIAVASVPDAPPDPPEQDFSHTDQDRIRVLYGTLGGGAYDGGSPIVGYDLWRDDGAGGDFVSLYGSQAASQSILALAYTDYEVDEGATYRYQYRARNINGWGDFSGVSYLFAAARPPQPAAPTLLSVTDEEMVL